MDARKEITRGVLWLGSASLLSQVVDAVSIVIVLWYLDRAQIGVATVAWSVAVVMEAFNGLGVATAIVQAKSLDERQLSTLYWYVMGFAVLAVGALVMAAPLIAGFYDMPDLTPMIRLSALKLLFVGAALVPLQLLVRQHEFHRVGAISTAATLLNNITKIALAAGGCGAWSLVISHAAHGVFVLIGVALLGHFRPRWVFDFAAVRPQVTFGLNAAGSGILFQLYRNVDYLLIGRLAGSSVLGLYRVAFDLAMGPAKALLDVVNGSSLPVMSKVAEDREKLAETFLYVTRTLGLVLAPVCTFLYFGAETLLSVAVRPEWQGAAPALQLLCIAAFIRSFAQSFPRLFHAASKPTWAIYEAAMSLLVISVGLSAFLVVLGEHYAELAACFAWLAASPIQLAALIVFARRLIPLSPPAYFRQWLPGLAGAMCIGLSLWTFQRLAPPLPGPVELGALLAIGLGIYMVFLRYGLGIDLRRRRDPKLQEQLMMQDASGQKLPKVSVVVRSYKRVPEMAKLVRLLCAQDYPDFEIIVIEQTPGIDASQAEEIERLRGLPGVYVHTYPPLGCAGARTASVKHTRGEILLFIDDDDLPAQKDWILRHALNYRDPCCLGVSGGESGRTSGNPERDRRLCLTYDFFKMPRQRNGHGTRVTTIQWMPGSNCSLRRSVVDAAAGWDEVGLLNHEEHSFYYRLNRIKPPQAYLVFDPEAVVHRRFDVPGGAAVRGAPVLSTLLDELRLSHLIVRRQFPLRFALLYPAYLWLACQRTVAFCLRTRPRSQTAALIREVLANLPLALTQVRERARQYGTS